MHRVYLFATSVTDSLSENAWESKGVELLLKFIFQLTLTLEFDKQTLFEVKRFLVLCSVSFILHDVNYPMLKQLS